MYEYKKTTSLAKLELPYGVDVKLDTLPLRSPFVPRICDKQAHMFIWWGTKETDPDIYEKVKKTKGEDMWINCDDDWKLEKGVAMIHIYDNEIIIGSVKYSGVLKSRSKIKIRQLLRKMWSDIIKLFGNKKIIVPAGSYFEHLHLIMNQKKIQHEPYHKELMQQFGFKRNGNYWIRWT
jgi:hypothetical protein